MLPNRLIEFVDVIINAFIYNSDVNLKTGIQVIIIVGNVVINATFIKAYISINNIITGVNVLKANKVIIGSRI